LQSLNLQQQLLLLLLLLLQVLLLLLLLLWGLLLLLLLLQLLVVVMVVVVLLLLVLLVVLVVLVVMLLLERILLLVEVLMVKYRILRRRSRSCRLRCEGRNWPLLPRRRCTRRLLHLHWLGRSRVSREPVRHPRVSGEGAPLPCPPPRQGRGEGNWGFTARPPRGSPRHEGGSCRSCWRWWLVQGRW